MDTEVTPMYIEKWKETVFGTHALINEIGDFSVAIFGFEDPFPAVSINVVTDLNPDAPFTVVGCWLDEIDMVSAIAIARRIE
jgi:hypothetical protein